MNNHTMPVLKDRERKKQVEIITASINKIVSDCANGWTKERDYLLPLQIALASLEAEPEYVRLFGTYGYGDRCWAECGKSEQGAIAHYPAPPVPALKLPDEMHFVNWHPNCGYDSEDAEGVKVGFNLCLAETKRLNGVTE